MALRTINYCEPKVMRELNPYFVVDLKRAGKDGKFEGKKTPPRKKRVVFPSRNALEAQAEKG